MTSSATAFQQADQICPKFSFLARASARYYMVERGVIALDVAFEGLVQTFFEIIETDHLVDQWERDFPPPPPRQRIERRPTPQATIEAIVYSVSQRGIVALSDPGNVERLSRCDQAAKDQINGRIEQRSAA